VLARIRRALPKAGPTDGDLLARFVAAGDEEAFAALLGRHGPLVLSVCRRLVRHEQDAEDAFQATFLVLAQKAGSVARRDSVASWLYGVAYRTALRAREAAAKRRSRERQVEELPHPAVRPEEPQDWLALYAALDGLPEKYREAVALCDLEGLPRREAAARLGVPEGTLSSRLAAARRLLAARLARRGVILPAGALAASAAVPAALASSTVKMASLVAAGGLAAVAPPVAVLVKGAFRAMLLTKLKLAAAAALVLVLGAGGVTFRPVGPAPASAQAPKAPSELEALRKENELLKLNLAVVLEKVRAQEAELRALKGGHKAALGERETLSRDLALDLRVRDHPDTGRGPMGRGDTKAADVARVLDEALRALKGARDEGSRQKALDALEKGVKALRGGPTIDLSAPPAGRE
jgi:RNA polymerase sigma factor (sigma-70 family)